MENVGEDNKSVTIRQSNGAQEDASLNEIHRMRYRMDNVPIGIQVRTLEFVIEEKFIKKFTDGDLYPLLLNFNYTF